MADNSAQGGSDLIRDLARQGGGVKTQVMQLDLGGASANAEVLITAGQQVMALSVPVVLASNHTPISVAGAAAANVLGQSLAVTAGATATLVNVAINVSGYQVKGLVAHGTGDGYFAVQINNVTVLSGRIRSSLPTLVMTLPNGIAVTSGQTVKLNVTNESGSTADYEATLLGA